MIGYVAGCAVLTAHTVPVLAADVTTGWTVLSLTAIAAMLVILTWTTLRRRPLPGEPALTPVLLAVAGGALSGPVRIMTITIPVFAALALHGSTRGWLIRTVLGLAVIPAGTALAAMSGATALSWRSSDALGLVPFVVPVGLVMRSIGRVLAQQQMVSDRDVLLSSAGGRILAAGDVDEVHRIGVELTNRMLDVNPGLAMVIVRTDGGGLRVARAMGCAPGLVGREVTEATLADPATGFADVMPGFPHWHVERVIDRYLLLGGRRPVTAPEADAFRTLVHQVVLGERNMSSRAELQYRARHDPLTKLANREYLFEMLTDALASGAAGTVAVITVDLDDFKRVNDTYGHGGGDELLVEVARRLRTTVGPHGSAARLGGDEFAVLLTALADESDAGRMAWELRDSIVAPVQVSGNPVRVGASIGVSCGGSPVDSDELLRRADLAMYAAKSAGKNSVEWFRPVPVTG